MRMLVKLPKLGDTASDAAVVEWLCAVGDTVGRDQPIALAETNKATVEVPAPAAGTVVELLVELDVDLEVGAALCVLETADDS